MTLSTDTAAMLDRPAATDAADRPLTLRDILAKPFLELGRGGCMRAYGSADGRFVFKHQLPEAEIIAWYASDGLAMTDLGWASHLGVTAEGIAQGILAEARASYRLAAQALSAEAGLVHVHLPAPGIMMPVFGICGTSVDPRQDPFVVQYRAELVRNRIDRLQAAGEHSACLQVIDDVVALVASIWRKSIAEQTLNFHNNCGYANGRLIQVDVGELCHSRDMVLEHARTEKILRKKSQAWLAQRYPLLADYLADRVRAVLTPDAVSECWEHGQV